MPPRTPAVSRAAGTVAITVRHHGPDDPRLPGMRRDLRAESLAARIERDVAEWPPLTQEQRDRLALLLLRPAGGDPA